MTCSRSTAQHHPLSNNEINKHISLYSPLTRLSTPPCAEEGLIKVYEFDHDAIIKFGTELEKANLCFVTWASCCFLCPCSAPAYCCMIDDNVKDRVYATHVALTQDGIKVRGVSSNVAYASNTSNNILPRFARLVHRRPPQEGLSL